MAAELFDRLPLSPIRGAAAVLSAALLLSCSAYAVDLGPVDVSGQVSVEMRQFTQDSDFDEPGRATGSFALAPEFYIASEDDVHSLLFSPFVRYDSDDSERTHADVRELLYSFFQDDWELRVGLGKVFWGVTEAQHLVDIVNQDDGVENIDGEDKLGQPMINLALIRDYGTLSFFVLPGFRERTFAGIDGRFRPGLPVDTDRAQFESGAGNKHVDYAIRYSHVLGDVDLGLSYFYGTSRDPELVRATAGNGQPRLLPRYSLVHQVGIDLQATKDAALWKLESVFRSGQGDSNVAYAAGIEYTLYGLMGSPLDVGLLAEHMFDSRGSSGPSPFNNDLLLGARFTLNDEASSELLAGVITDLSGSGTSLNVEASRRIGDRFKVEMEARTWSGMARGDPLRSLQHDDYVQITLQAFF